MPRTKHHSTFLVVLIKLKTYYQLNLEMINKSRHTGRTTRNIVEMKSSIFLNVHVGLVYTFHEF